MAITPDGDVAIVDVGDLEPSDDGEEPDGCKGLVSPPQPVPPPQTEE